MKEIYLDGRREFVSKEHCLLIKTSDTKHQSLINVVQNDGIYPEQEVETYLDYYQMTKSEFDIVTSK